MTKTIQLAAAVTVLLTMVSYAWAQEPATVENEPTTPTLESAQEELDELSGRVNQSEQAQNVRAGILKPIYSLAETFSFSAFHWIAFAIMFTGVVSFALQLTLGKLVVLSRASFSPSEVLSDLLGLAVSLIGLVLTTQAATENSNFTSSAMAVISSTCVGALVGLIFYIWGQRQELQAATGRKRADSLEHGSTKPTRT
jgi:hypothetical protein